jgi:tripartite-type tricarboxylate transporter receptor subunit TctC
MSGDLVAKYRNTLLEILAEPDVIGNLAKQGASVRTSTPEELNRANREDYEMLAKLIKDANIKGD